jgi:predicted anti-sigma-YlaC factor YlaD
MKNQICEFEKAVIKESAQGIRTEKLVLHVKECAACREALKVASWMQNFAATAAPKCALPTAGFLRWKSKIIEKREAGRRAAQPIVWTQTAAILLVVITTAWLLIKYQSKFPTVIENFSASFELIAVPFLFAFIFAAFVCLAVSLKWREPSRKN